MKIRILIVDDEPLARESVRLLLGDRDDVEVVGEAGDGRQAIDQIREHAPDLVFLDIQMPEADGFEVVRQIGPEEMPVVIFATAYDEYALKAFEARALDYLLKPFDDDRFDDALERAVRRIREHRIGDMGRALAELVSSGTPGGGAESAGPAPVAAGASADATGRSGPGGAVDGAKRGDAVDPADRPADRIMIRERDVVRFVNVDDILWVEAAGDYVTLHTEGRKHLLRETMTGMERRLPDRFIRIHRSSIVDVDRVRELRPYFHGDYIVYLQDGTELRLSRRYWKKVEPVLGGR